MLSEHLVEYMYRNLYYIQLIHVDRLHVHRTTPPPPTHTLSFTLDSHEVLDRGGWHWTASTAGYWGGRVQRGYWLPQGAEGQREIEKLYQLYTRQQAMGLQTKDRWFASQLGECSRCRCIFITPLCVHAWSRGRVIWLCGLSVCVCVWMDQKMSCLSELDTFTVTANETVKINV